MPTQPMRGGSGIASRYRERVPTPAVVLGLAGALPFIAAALSAWLPDSRWSAVLSPSVAVAYGAVILSFLGGTIWGLATAAAGDPLAIDSARLFAVSVVPSLVAWAALLLGPSAALIVLAVAFAVQLVVDCWIAQLQLVPPWWLRLRVPLTVIVVASLIATAIPG